MFKKFKQASIVSLLLALCQAAHALECVEAKQIEGVYMCKGECIITSNGVQSLISVSGEKDTISAYPGSRHGLYQIKIEGSEGFTETEIGALHQRSLYTATSQVSDGQYPVLENYLFQTNRKCQAKSYTKIVRNPTQAQFKACNIICHKSNTQLQKP